MKHLRTILSGVFVASLLVLLVGCGSKQSNAPAAASKPDTAGQPSQSAPSKPAAEKSESPAAPVTITAADRTEAANIFKTRCSVCHGMNGEGDGPAAAGLNPKPQNYTSEAWQKSVTDATIEKAIVQGGASVGRSALMAPNPDLKDKPGVVAALKDKIRSFQKNS